MYGGGVSREGGGHNFACDDGPAGEKSELPQTIVLYLYQNCEFQPASIVQWPGAS